MCGKNESGRGERLLAVLTIHLAGAARVYSPLGAAVRSNPRSWAHLDSPQIKQHVRQVIAVLKEGLVLRQFFRRRKTSLFSDHFHCQSSR